MSKTPRLITIFTPSHADEDSTNAQQLTVKEIVARLPPERFHVTMFSGPRPDPRIQARPNTQLVATSRHGNTMRFLTRLLLARPDIYFFPRAGPVDRIFFDARKRFRLRTALVTYIVMAMDATIAGGMTGRSIREADVVLSNSKHVANTIFDNFGVEAAPIYDGIDRRHYFPSKEHIENPAPIVLYAGSFEPRKRVEQVIEQAARHPDVKFRLAGRGVTLASCRTLAQQLGCHNVEFIGHLPSAELADEMRQADVFLFPSILEGHPQVLGQASACALPSIAMNVYHPEYVRNGVSGFLVESDAELAEKLDLLLRDATLRRSMSRAAAQLALDFDWDRIALQWQGVFEGVTANR
jgi:glycosyltransferase involved in cell wall biosynthesis